MKKAAAILSILFVTGLNFSVFDIANAANIDLFIPVNTFSIAPEPRVEGQSVRLYAQAQTAETIDAYGTITFFAEGTPIGTPQPISIINGVSDAVFMDWIPAFGGFIDLTISASLNDDTDTDLSNNTATIKDIFIDYDSDGDGIGNAADIDDDNDGVPDTEDAFPTDNSESADADSDGIGDNADPDDNNDGIADESDSDSQNPTQGQSPSSSTPGSLSQGSGAATSEPSPSQPSASASGASTSGSSAVTPSQASGSASPTPGRVDEIGGPPLVRSATIDTDSDGVVDALDLFPENPQESADTDNDGIGNNADLDDDNDEISDEIEIQFGLNPLQPNSSTERDSIFDQIDQQVLGEKIISDEKVQSATSPLNLISLGILLLAGLSSLFLYFRKKTTNHL
jgi:hypothetical protein